MGAMKRYQLCAVLLLLGGCAHVDTGQIDYRVVERPEAADKIDSRIKECVRDGTECQPITSSRLIRKYVANHQPITATEVFSIELEQAVIGDNLMEGHVLGQQVGKTGEFAILANAFEFGSDEQAKRFLESPEYSPEKKEGEAESDVELKLVYFGDDVRRYQALNFSNLPLLPRETYDGGSVGVQIVIMEVDARSGPVTSLLKTLAKFGQRSLPGVPEAANIIFDLGESLLQGSQDDRLFDFRFVMSSGAAIDEQGNLGPIATFAPGRYVFRRGQQRTLPLNWKDLSFDYNTGRLYRNGREVRDELYLVLNVRKYPTGTTAENYEQLSWASFRQTVQAAADRRDAPIEALTKNFTELLMDNRSKKWRVLLNKQWSAAEEKLKHLSRRTVQNIDGLDTSSCPAVRTRAMLIKDNAARDAQDALRTFVATYKAATSATFKKTEESEPEAEFKVEDREAIVSAVARYFMPWADDQVRASFASATSYETAFFSADDSPLTELATSTAQQRGVSVVDCATLETVLT